ncbi:MAG: universal stress protein [Halarchaeum sp.]
MGSENHEEVWPVTSTRETGSGRGRTLVSLPGNRDNGSVLAVGEALADGTDGGLALVRPELFPVQTPLDRSQETLEAAKRRLGFVVDTVREGGYDGPLSAVVRSGRTLDAALSTSANECDADFVVLTSETPELTSVVESVDCDVVSVRPDPLSERTRAVLVPVAGGPHSRLAARVGGALARHFGAWVELLHVVDPDLSPAARARREDLLADLASAVGSDVEVDTRITEEADVVDAIVEQGEFYDCTVIGAPTSGRLTRFAFGSKSEDLQTSVSGPVLTVWDRSNHGPT